MMREDEQESLDANTWIDRMGRLLDGIGESDGAPERHIRMAYHLHCLAPHPFKAMMATPIEEERFEAMLACGAYESAVASLIGTAGQITVSYDGVDAGIEVRLRVRHVSSGVDDISASWPTAMLEAWAVTFLRLRPRLN